MPSVLSPKKTLNKASSYYSTTFCFFAESWNTFLELDVWFGESSNTLKTKRWRTMLQIYCATKIRHDLDDIVCKKTTVFAK